ncbi:MAG: hypothetical protein HOP10_15280 [Chitinophagaceae bacterium]|nr:hypothetical protein [Chitinophagaceae bacterium]
MKKILLVITISLASLAVGAQNYENIKNMVILTQYQKAKEDLDKAMSNTKFVSKPEAFILKASIYGALSMDDNKKNTPEGDQLTNDGDVAFKKFREMDPSMALLGDLVYQNGPINLYSSYYTSGYNDYNAAGELDRQKKKATEDQLKTITENAIKKWDAAYAKLKKAVEYSDLLIEKKLLNVAIDTNVLILAGITAENSSTKNEAIKYYTRLADMKITGDGFESVYRYLVSYYFQKKDIPLFEKYKTIGAEMYPNSEFFTFDKVDFAVGLATNFAEKLKAVEELLANDPNSFKGNEVLGEIIYDTLNPRDETAVLPSNADDLEKKMVAAFLKAGAAKPDYENPYIYIGDHFINKAVKVNDEREAHVADMKTRTKPGQPNSKEDVAKRDALDKKYGDALELAREPYEKAAQIFGARTTLSPRDKQQYKKAVSYLGDIASFKKVQAKNKKSPDAAKYEAEEKKWISLWESIK